MTEQQPQSPDFLFSERALVSAKAAGAIAVEIDPVQLAGLFDFANTRLTREAFPSIGAMTLVAMQPSKLPWKSDKHLYQQPDSLGLYHPDRLRTEHTWPSTTLQQARASGKDLFEFRPWNWNGSLTHALARRALGPPPQEAKMAAGASAWAREMKSLSPAQAAQYTEEAVKLFPGAVVMRHGPRGRVG